MNSSSVVLNIESYDKWYERLGHVNVGSIKRLVNKNLILKIDLHQTSSVKFVFGLNILRNLLSQLLVSLDL